MKFKHMFAYILRQLLCCPAAFHFVNPSTSLIHTYILTGYLKEADRGRGDGLNNIFISERALAASQPLTFGLPGA